MLDQTATIHTVTRDTISLLDEVDDDVFDNRVNPDLVNDYLCNMSNALLVAMIEGTVVGMVTGIAYVHPDKPKSLFINEIGVSTRFQRRGIGTQLISAILEWGRNHGCVEAWVAATVDDVTARSFYNAIGGIEETKHAVVYTYPLQTQTQRSGPA